MWDRIAPGRKTGVALAVAMAASLLATPASASWGPKVQLRNAAQAARMSAASGGSMVVAAWIAERFEPGPLYVRVSDDRGTSFLPRVKLGGDVDQVATAVCGGLALVAFVQRLTPDDGRVMLAVRHPDGPSLAPTPVHQGPVMGGDLAVACGGGRVWVVWTEQVGAVPHTFARHAPVATLAWSAVEDIGQSIQLGVTVAATAKLAVVGFRTANGVRIKRYTMSAAPGGPVTGHPSKSIAADGWDPMLAADGQRVALGYTRNMDAWVRLSTNGALSFGTPRKLAENGGDEDGPAAAWLFSLAVHGPRVVAVLAVQWPPVPLFYRQRTADFGGHWVNQKLGLDEHLTGYVWGAGGTVMADVTQHTGWWDEPMDFDIWFRRQS